MSQTYSKDFFQSKTTWGALILLIDPALKAAGVQIDSAGVVEALTTISGTLIFLWGQFTRKAEINSVAGLKVKS